MAIRHAAGRREFPRLPRTDNWTAIRDGRIREVTSTAPEDKHGAKADGSKAERTVQAVATRLAAALRAAERARACTAARRRRAHSYSVANTASARAITTRPGPGATSRTTPTARITVPATVTAILRSKLARSFTSATMPVLT